MADAGEARVMAVMIAGLYDALRAAGAPEDKAREAAVAVASYERRLARPETMIAVNTAVLTVNTGLVIAVAGRLFQLF